MQHRQTDADRPTARDGRLPPPTLASVTRLSGVPFRPEQVVSMLLAEQQRGWPDNAPPRLEDFAELLAEVGANDDHWIELILNEVALRRERGQKPDPEEYARRFPSLAGRIRAGMGRAPRVDTAQFPFALRQEGMSSSAVALFESPDSKAGSAVCLIEPDPEAKADQPSTLSADELDSAAKRTLQGRPPEPDDVDGPEVPGAIHIPGYEILGELGRGGMGVVYKARQLGLNRLVALKMILAGSKERGARARFMREAESVARLKHPNIVHVYEIGDYHGKPFLSLEYVDGGNLDERINGRPLPPELAARIAEQMARAVQHAHEQGIIHRDLKPANVLIANGKPPSDPRTPAVPPGVLRTRRPEVPTAASLATATPKITDFGLAKQLDNQVDLTATNAVAGTPGYMAPEQVYAGKRHQLGPATDIHALGVILYEMLTGHPPFLAETALEMMELVVRKQPVPPSQLQPRVPPDLETICLKCLEKEPGRRYASALDLADDLKLFLQGGAISARPTGKGQQAWRWCQRNPAVAALLTVVGLTLALGSGVATFFAIRAAEQARRAEDRSADAKRSEEAAVAAREEEARLNRLALRREERHGRELYAARMNLARRDWEAGRVARTRQILDAYAPHGGTDLRGLEWYYLERLCHMESLRFVAPDPAAVAVSADGRRVAWSAGEAAEVWDLRARKPLWTLKGHTGRVCCVAFDPAGAWIATASEDKTVRLWDARTGGLSRFLAGPTLPPTGLCFSPDGSRLARTGGTRTGQGTDGELNVWETKSGDPAFAPPGKLPALRGAAFAREGNWLAAAGEDGAVHLWNAAGTSLAPLPVRDEVLVSVACAPGAGLIAAGTANGAVVLCDVAARRELRRFFGHGGRVGAVAFSADGNTLAAAGEDNVIRVWDVRAAGPARQFPGHTRSIEGLAFAPEGAVLFSASRDGTVRGWEVDREPEYRSASLLGRPAGLHALPGGRFAAINVNGEYLVSDPAARSPAVPPARLDGKEPLVTASTVAPDGTTVVFARGDSMFRWRIGSNRPEPFRLAGLRPQVRQVIYSPDGRRLVTAHEDGTVQVHTPGSISVPVEVRFDKASISSVAFHPRSSSRLALGTSQGGVALYELGAGTPVFTTRGHRAAVRSVAFSPDGAWLASASDDGTAKVWDAVAAGAEPVERVTLEGHTSGVRQVVFCPTGKRLVTGGEDRTVRFWDLESGFETLTLPAHIQAVTAVTFSRDGRTLLTQGADGEVRAWPTGMPVGNEPVAAAARTAGN